MPLPESPDELTEGKARDGFLPWSCKGLERQHAWAHRIFHQWRGLHLATAPTATPGQHCPELGQQGGWANLFLECSCKGRAHMYRICR